MFHLNTTVTTHIALHAYDATNGNIKVLQPYPNVAVFALLQISTAISAVLQLDKHVLQKTPPVSQKFVTSWCIAVLFGTSLSVYAFQNASQTAANNIDAKRQSRMNTRPACEYMFLPVQLLHYWHK
jgi:hypothetical protein